MGWLRSNADLAVMGVGLGVVSLAYTLGAAFMGLALHTTNRLGWGPVEVVAVGLYPLGWIGLGWAATEIWTRRRRRKRIAG
jgi:hypothetical protein